MKDAWRPLLRSASAARQLWTIAIFLHLHILITADLQLRYQQFTKLGYTIDENKPCLFDCVDGRCRAGESRELVPCRDSGELAPTFHTIRESSHEYCLSNCGKFGTDYEWCYVDSYDKWDYCSSVTENKMITDRSFTLDGKACSDECTYRGYYYLWCHTFDNSWGKCDPGVYSYVQAYTARGTPCWGRCEKHTAGELSKHAYNVCESSADIAEGCAPPALPVAQLNHMLSCLPETNQCPAIKRRRRRNVTPTHSELTRRNRRNVTFTECVDVVSDNLARIPIMSTTILANPTNPVFSYTVIPAAYTGRATLPVVVRARITPDTIRAGRRRDMPSSVLTNLRAMGMITVGENRDEAGHLIGSQFGGLETVYNVAPQTRRLNRGTGRFNDYPQWRPSVWYHRDENIRSFIDRTNGTADLTVTVRYDLMRSFRPIGFHVREVLRNPDGSVAYEYPDFYYSNDPDHVE